MGLIVMVTRADNGQKQAVDTDDIAFLAKGLQRREWNASPRSDNNTADTCTIGLKSGELIDFGEWNGWRGDEMQWFVRTRRDHMWAIWGVNVRGGTDPSQQLEVFADPDYITAVVPGLFEGNELKGFVAVAGHNFDYEGGLERAIDRIFSRYDPQLVRHIEVDLGVCQNPEEAVFLVGLWGYQTSLDQNRAAVLIAGETVRTTIQPSSSPAVKEAVSRAVRAEVEAHYDIPRQKPPFSPFGNPAYYQSAAESPELFL